MSMSCKDGHSRQVHTLVTLALPVFQSRSARRFTRRFICSVAYLFLGTAVSAANTIQIENAKPGTTEWQTTNIAYNHEIEGYASLTSINRGGKISFYVNTGASTYTMDIFRMGWYGGAGGRRMLPTIQLPGTQQPIPTSDPVTGLIECNWSVSYVLNTSDPSDWASGVYLAKLTVRSTGKERYIIFVVRDDARPSDYFFQTSVNTYQAYNNWGGKSLYDFNSTGGQARKVSFNRPYADSYGNDGSGDFLNGWEYNMVRFLEREGYDVTYGTDVDVHENPNILLSHKAYLAVGHDEYWSWEMRTNVVAARDQDVSLGFFAANTCYWQVRFEPSVVNSAPDRTMVGYKEFALTEDPYYLYYLSSGDPSKLHLVTDRWREYPVNLPEDAFVGVMYDGYPVNADIVVTNASNWVFNTTGLVNNSHLPGLLGYEVDRMFGHAPSNTVRLAHSPYPLNGTTRYSDMTVYTAASGATVFAAGSIQWSWGVDDYNPPDVPRPANPAAQQIMRNILARFISDLPPLANPGGPYAGGVAQILQFDGSRSSDLDGVVTSYEWDFGDGATATGVSPTHAFSAPGTYTVTLMVTDDKGSRNAGSTIAAIDVPAVTLSAKSLAFPGEPIGTKSLPKTVTVTNSGSAKLTVSSLGISGDFAQTNNCIAGVAPGASCTISVTFTPTGYGTRTGFLVITDNAASSPQTVALTGFGPDFTMAASPSSATVTHGQSVTSNITLTPKFGFNQTVSLTCAVPASKGIACSVSPNSVTLNGSNPASAALTINTSTFTPAGTYKISAIGTFSTLIHSTSVKLNVQ